MGAVEHDLVLLEPALLDISKVDLLAGNPGYPGIIIFVILLQ
jgi:hypothetical protein